MKNPEIERIEEAFSKLRKNYSAIAEPLTQKQLKDIFFILQSTFALKVINMMTGYDETKIRQELDVLGHGDLQIHIGDYVFWCAALYDLFEVRYSQRTALSQPLVTVKPTA